MGFLRRFLGGDRGERQEAGHDADPGATEEIGPHDARDDGDMPPDPRQGVTVWLHLDDASFDTGREQMRVFAFEDALMKALDASGAGTHDTNDLVRGFFAIRLAGPDADAIVAAIGPALTGMPEGSYVTRRPGPSGTSEERVDLEPAATG